jgi:2-polyprenyl-3-methyl-5-hydroxy-6-metoxy-1,4-benzoquinol methylase
MCGVTNSLFGESRAAVDAAMPVREFVECPLCKESPKPFAVDFQGLQLARCEKCKLEFQHPRPVFEQLTSVVYGASYHPPSHKSVNRFRGAHYEQQLDRLATHLPQNRRALLDVGCGAGAFISFASTRGWRVEGTDIRLSETASQTGVRLWEGQLPVIPFGDVSFDAIRFNHVLEHTQNPLVELQRARQLIGADGVLLVGVPNISGLSVQLKTWQSRLRLKAKPWKHYGALHHLWFFTPRTLAKIVTAAGFEVIHCETPVFERAERPRWITSMIRAPLELLKVGGVIDLYARAR